MKTYMDLRLIGVIALTLGVAVLFGGFLIPLVHAVVVDTVSVHLEKKFSGPVPLGYTPDMFSFEVTGTGSTTFATQTVTLVNGNDDTADGTIDLPIGTYLIEEVGPNDFVEGQWRPGWYAECEMSDNDDFSATLVIDDSNIDHGTLDCQVDNQWRFGSLRVQKVIMGTTSTAYKDFEFTVTQEDAVIHDGAFDADGDMEFIVGEGEYVVEESNYPDFVATYSGDCDENGEGTMDFEDSQTCIITNTWSAPTYSQGTYYSQASYNGYSQGTYYTQATYNGYSQGTYYTQASYNGYSQGSYGGGYSQGTYYSQASYNGGGGYSQGSYGGSGGGNGRSISLRDGGGSSNSNDDDDESDSNDAPAPQVLGDSMSVLPTGGPDTGKGGTSPVVPSSPHQGLWALYSYPTLRNKLLL